MSLALGIKAYRERTLIYYTTYLKLSERKRKYRPFLDP
jgi:hypothetical protein